MKIGDHFSSWEDFFHHLKEYEDYVYANYYVRDSKTLESYSKKLKTRRPNFNPALKYYNAYINCVKGGRNFIPKSKAIRNSRTGRTGCPAFVYLRVSECGQFLVIRKMNETHGHPVSQSLYKASAQQRLNIDASILRKYQHALACHANKKVVQNEIFEETGKLLTLKDLTNMRSKGYRESNMSDSSGEGANIIVDNSGEGPKTITILNNSEGLKTDSHGMHVETHTAVDNLIIVDANVDANNTMCEDITLACHESQTTIPLPSSFQKNIIDSINLLQDVYKCDVHVFADYRCTPAAIYFQDKEMKSMFRAYPEIIFVDSVDDLVENRATTYLIVVEDANGRGVLVAAGILLNEQQETLDWFFKKFRDTNPSSCDTSVIMTDKDLGVRYSLRNLFPKASLQICLFHTLQLFNHEISARQMEISTEDTKRVKAYLSQLANCTSEGRYREIYAELMRTAPDTVCSYFNQHWEPIRDEWAVYATSRKRGFTNKTNNKVKNMNKLLRSVIAKDSPLQVFIKYFFVTLNSNRTNNIVTSSRKLYSVTTASTTKEVEDSVQKDYENLLTPFAFSKLKPNLERTNESLVYNFETLDDVFYCCHTSEGQVKLSTTTCDCPFFSSMGLPCDHIFSLRRCFDLPLFDRSLVLDRWTKEYTLSIHPLNTEPSIHPPNHSSAHQSCSKKEPLSYQNSSTNWCDSQSHNFHPPARTKVSNQSYQDSKSSSFTPIQTSNHSHGETSNRRMSNFQTSNLHTETSNAHSGTSNFHSETSNPRTSNLDLEMSNLHSEPPNPKSKTSNLRTSNLDSETSNLHSETSNLESETSNLRSETSNLRTSNLDSETSNPCTSNVDSETSNLRTSNVKREESSATEFVLGGHGFRILRKRVLTEAEKVEKMSKQCEILCRLSGEVSATVFEKRMKLLRDLERVWGSNQDEKVNRAVSNSAEVPVLYKNSSDFIIGS